MVEGCMREHLNIDLIFPIKDDVSAWVMCLKAESLYEAGIIDTDEMNTVLERAAAVLDQASKQVAYYQVVGTDLFSSRGYV
jgi:hypothetical protein